MRIRPNPQAVDEFVVAQVESNPSTLVALVATQFGISRQAALRHVQRLVQSEVLACRGTTRARRYELQRRSIVDVTLTVAGLEEDVPWREIVAPKLTGWPANVVLICQHGFTEMLNNVIDHSDSELVHIEVQMTAGGLIMTIVDAGVGLFRRLQERFGFHTVEEAMLELVKGKLTTDPRHHSGEGIFFSSRLFDRFTINSGTAELVHMEPVDDWIQGDCEMTVAGTAVRMEIAKNSPRQQREVFNRFADEDFRFSRTHVPVSLVRIGVENLVSRSQARRLLARFEQFDEIVLDFRGVEEIGQAFADEVFRVFQLQNPKLRLLPANENLSISRMIQRVTAEFDE